MLPNVARLLRHRSKSQPNVAPQTRRFSSAHPEEADESVKLLLQRGSLGGQGQPVVPAGHGDSPCQEARAMVGALSPPRWRTRGFRGYQEPGLQKQSHRPHGRRRRRRKGSTCRKAGGRRVCDRPPPSPGCPPRTAPARRGARPASARCRCRRSRRSRSAARSHGSSGDEDPSSKPVGRPPPPTTPPAHLRAGGGGGGCVQ